MKQTSLDSFLQRGSNNPFYSKKHSEETKKKMRDAWTPERKKRQSEKWITKHHTEETKRKMREAWRHKVANGFHGPWYGKHLTEETKRKLSEAMKGKYAGPNHSRYGVHLTEETKRKIGSANRRRFIEKDETGRAVKHHLYNKTHTEEARKKIRDRRSKQIFPKKESTIEVKIQQHLKALEIDFMAHHWMNIQHAYQCDIYIPAWNVVIECDGTYWHKYPLGREIDHLRTKELVEKGYKVLRLWEHEIKEMTAEDLKRKLEETAQVRIGVNE